MSKLAVILALFCAAGCAHRARVHEPPSAVAMQESHARLAKAVTAATVTAGKARAAVAKVETSVAAETTQIAVIGPKLFDLFKIAPLELQPLIEEISGDVRRLEDAHTLTVAQVEDARVQQAILATQLEEAHTAKAQAAKDQAEYVAKANKLAEAATVAESAWEKNSREIVKLRTQSWLFKLGTGLAVLAVGGLAFLWFSGRIASALR